MLFIKLVGRQFFLHLLVAPEGLPEGRQLRTLLGIFLVKALIPNDLRLTQEAFKFLEKLLVVRKCGTYY